MKRTFIAIKIKAGNKLSQAHTKLRNELKNEKIKWVEADNFHVTLFFLGDTSDEQVEQVQQMLPGLTSSFHAFDIRLQGLGVFKNLRKPRVLWAGISDYHPLKALKESLDHEMEKLGYTPEQREFRPHLTLARMKWIDDKNRLEQLLREYEGEEWQKARIDELIFFESKLSSTGPVYTPINRYRLNESGQ